MPNRILHFGPCRVEVYNDIDDIRAEAWDSLVSDNDVQRKHRFIRTCQRARVEESTFRHVMVYSAADLVAVATLSLMDVRLDLLSGAGASAIVARMRRLWPRLLCARILICGPPVSFGQPSVTFAPGAGREIVHALRHTVEAVAAELGAPMCCFKEFNNADSEQMNDLVHKGYTRAYSLPFSYLSIGWRSFDEYIASMRSGYRRQLLRDRDPARDPAFDIRIEVDLRSSIDVVYPLYLQVIDRARYKLERLPRAFFAELAANFGDSASAVLVGEGNQTVAAAILLANGTELTFLVAGIDYHHHEHRKAYRLLLTLIVEQAIATGASRLHMGQTSWDLKARLGAQVADRFVFLHHRSPLMNRALHRCAPLLFPRMVIPPRRVFRGQRERRSAEASRSRIVEPLSAD